MRFVGQKLLVTGATGFIGGHVVRRLLGEEGAIVRALVRDVVKAEDLKKLGAEVVVGDLGNYETLERAADGCSVVIHTAAQVSSVPDRKIFDQSNIEGTRNLLRASMLAGVSRFVHLSSIAVFGLAASGDVTDLTPRRPSGDPYCDTKLEAEEAVFRAHRESGVPVVILRPSAVFGPGSTHWSIVPIKRIKKGKLLLFNGGRGLLNYVYIDNLVDAMMLVSQNEHTVGEAFIVNDGAATWEQFFGAYARMAGQPRIRSIPLWAGKLWVHYRNLFAALRGESYRVHPNALGFLVATAIYRQVHLEQKLGYRPRVGLEEGLQRTEAWFHEVGLL